MPALIKTLIDVNDNIIYPQTKTKAVYTEDNVLLQNILDDIDSSKADKSSINTFNGTATYADGLVNITVDSYGKTNYMLTFIAPSDFRSQDTYKINNITTILTDLNNEPIKKAWTSGSPVSLNIVGNKAFFKAGGLEPPTGTLVECSPFADIVAPNFIIGDETYVVMSNSLMTAVYKDEELLYNFILQIDYDRLTIEDGYLYITLRGTSYPNGAYVLVSKMDLSTGGIVWTNHILDNTTDAQLHTSNVIIEGDFVYSHSCLQCVKINKTTGDTVWTKPIAWSNSGASTKAIFSHSIYQGVIYALRNESSYKSIYKIDTNVGGNLSSVAVASSIPYGVCNGKYCYYGNGTNVYKKDCSTNTDIWTFTAPFSTQLFYCSNDGTKITVTNGSSQGILVSNNKVITYLLEGYGTTYYFPLNDCCYITCNNQHTFKINYQQSYTDPTIASHFIFANNVPPVVVCSNTTKRYLMKSGFKGIIEQDIITGKNLRTICHSQFDSTYPIASDDKCMYIRSPSNSTIINKYNIETFELIKTATLTISIYKIFINSEGNIIIPDSSFCSLYDNNINLIKKENVTSSSYNWTFLGAEKDLLHYYYGNSGVNYFYTYDANSLAKISDKTIGSNVINGYERIYNNKDVVVFRNSDTAVRIYNISSNQLSINPPSSISQTMYNLYDDIVLCGGENSSNTKEKNTWYMQSINNTFTNGIIPMMYNWESSRRKQLTNFQNNKVFAGSVGSNFYNTNKTLTPRRIGAVELPTDIIKIEYSKILKSYVCISTGGLYKITYQNKSFSVSAIPTPVFSWNYTARGNIIDKGKECIAGIGYSTTLYIINITKGTYSSQINLGKIISSLCFDDRKQAWCFLQNGNNSPDYAIANTMGIVQASTSLNLYGFVTDCVFYNGNIYGILGEKQLFKFNTTTKQVVGIVPLKTITVTDNGSLTIYNGKIYHRNIGYNEDLSIYDNGISICSDDRTASTKVGDYTVLYHLNSYWDNLIYNNLDNSVCGGGVNQQFNNYNNFSLTAIEELENHYFMCIGTKAHMMRLE